MSVRVIQWGSGNVGKQSIAEVVRRPELELVGLYVTNPDKVGLDAGAIAGIDATGVMATNNLEEVVATEADVVLHMPLPSLVYGDEPGADIDNFVQLLESGKHVITIVGYMYPRVHGPDVVDRLAAACEAGGACFHGTGANPGWFGDLLPLLMSGLSLRIDEIKIQEISDFSRYPSPEIMFDMMNFGRTPAEFEAAATRHRHWLDGLFTEAVHMVADGLGVSADGTTSQFEPWLTDVELHPAAGTIAAGTVAGQRYEWAATVGGRAVIRQETVWRMDPSVAPEWPVGDWSITIEGEPAMYINFPHGWNRNVLGSTGAHAINAIPYLLEAAPGIRTFLDLPTIAGRGAFA